MTAPVVDEFAVLARSFLAWCEGDAPGDVTDRDAARWLARLHAAALLLPDVDASCADDPAELDEATTTRARTRLARFNGRFYRDCHVPSPLLEDPPGLGDVGDDLLDIYLDLRRGLIDFDAGRVGAALWHWSFLHRIHWGRHAVGAMLALHALPESDRG